MSRTAVEVIETIAAVAPEIRSGLPGRRRKTDAQNPSNEVQLAADVWADERLEEELLAIDGVGSYASEEREAPIVAGEGVSLTVDPLDGSSNLQSNNAMGTILGVYDAPLPAPGRDLIAAAYVLYGPITTMTTAVEGTVTEYVIEDDGSMRTVREHVQLPDDPVVYGFGGRVPDWTSTFTEYAREIETELKLRYGGAMIADVNQVVTYGGVFAYPELESSPNGKLRLLFEGAPIAYIIESAGGRSSDGTRSLLEKAPASVHERTPVYLGNQPFIERREQL